MFNTQVTAHTTATELHKSQRQSTTENTRGDVSRVTTVDRISRSAVITFDGILNFCFRKKEK